MSEHKTVSKSFIANALAHSSQTYGKQQAQPQSKPCGVKVEISVTKK